MKLKKAKNNEKKPTETKKQFKKRKFGFYEKNIPILVRGAEIAAELMIKDVLTYLAAKKALVAKVKLTKLITFSTIGKILGSLLVDFIKSLLF